METIKRGDAVIVRDWSYVKEAQIASNEPTHPQVKYDGWRKPQYQFVVIQATGKFPVALEASLRKALPTSCWPWNNDMIIQDPETGIKLFIQKQFVRKIRNSNIIDVGIIRGGLIGQLCVSCIARD